MFNTSSPIKKVSYLIALLSTAFLAVSCGKKFEAGSLVREWGSMMREQQIIPVFPPREDIYVGDVYVSVENPNLMKNIQDFKGSFPIPILLQTKSFATNLKAHYRDRTQLPLTPTNSISTNDTQYRLLPAEQEATDSNLFATNDPTRLRHVAFPEFSYIRLDQGGLQAVIPVEALNVAVGANYGSAKEGYLKISSAESISFPALALHKEVSSLVFDKTPNSWKGKTEYATFFNQLAAKGETNVWVTVINEVFYARVLDVLISNKKAVGGALGVNASSPKTVLDMATNATAIAKALNSLNAELLSQSSPGGSVSFSSVSQLGIGLKRTFSRPIAVGYRGFTWQISLINGEWTLNGMSGAAHAPVILVPN